LENAGGTLGTQQEFSLIVSLTDLLLTTKQLLGLKKQGKFCRIEMKLAEVHEPHGPWLMNRMNSMVGEDGTRSIGEIAQELVISSRSVHRVLKDYPVRRNFCVWLLNKAGLVFGRIKFWSAELFIRVHFSVDLGTLYFQNGPFEFPMR
jgi:hypothetical protein